MLGFKRVKEDPLYNRRRFMIISFCYAVIWGFVILTCDLIWGFDVAKVTVYLGFISTLSGAGLFAYFKQCSKDTHHEGPDKNPKS